MSSIFMRNNILFHKIMLLERSSFLVCRIQNGTASHMIKTFSKVSHCIFDMDGTIIDTQSVYEKSCVQIFKKYGKEFTVDWRKKMTGLTSVDMWKLVQKELNIPIKWEDLQKENGERTKFAVQNCPLKPGVEKLLRHLNKFKVPMAVATSSTYESTVNKTRHIKELLNMFSHIVYGGTDKQVRKCKPYPDIYLICASRFSDKPKPLKCLVFEDSPIGVTAAILAGMQCVAVPDNIKSAEMVHATVVLNSLEDFRPELFGLPSI